MKIGCTEYSKSELLARVGRLSQIGGIQKITLEEGLEKGTEIIQVGTGAGLSFWVSPSKCMDIVHAEYCGSALSWSGVNGVVHPAHYNERGIGWLDSYSSGLLTTCGFANAGLNCEEDGVEYGLHGRAHNIPATGVSTRTFWVDDECHLEVSGSVCETVMFGHNITLTRVISAVMGRNKIEVFDKIENTTRRSTPLMLVYHCNFGFPLLAEKTSIEMPSESYEPRVNGIGPVPLTWQAPDKDYVEKVYYHRQLVTEEGIATARVTNPEFPIGAGHCGVQLEMCWDTKNLPELVEWYMPGDGTHALGIEPANCELAGRATERAKGAVVELEPGETKDYRLSFEIKAL